MNFISKKTVGDVELILLKEAMGEIGKEKLELLLESENLDVYDILVGWRYDRKNATSRKTLCTLQRGYDYVSCFEMGVIATIEPDEYKLVKPPDSKRPVQSFDFPTVLARIIWKSDASMDGLYILIDAIQQSKKVDRVEFVKSMRDDVKRTYKAVMKITGKLALNKATAYLGKNPSSYILPEYLTLEMFPESDKYDRSVKSSFVNVVLEKNGYNRMDQNEIMKILSK